MTLGQDQIFNVMVDTWVENAIQAKLYFNLGEHYVIEKGKILIVDKENTGEMK